MSDIGAGEVPVRHGNPSGPVLGRRIGAVPGGGPVMRTEPASRYRPEWLCRLGRVTLRDTPTTSRRADATCPNPPRLPSYLRPGRSRTTLTTTSSSYIAVSCPQVGSPVGGCTGHPGASAPVERVAKPKAAPSAPSEQATIYTCPVHPQIQSDKPGKCPICGMTLKKKEGGQ